MIEILKPYLGKKGKDASDFLQAYPLTITPDQANIIDKSVKAAHVRSLAQKYGTSPHNTAKKSFSDLPAEAQTVVASVAFQYGINLDVSTPRFWKAAASQNWEEAVNILRSFGIESPDSCGG